ncbi:MAG: tRNA pseudouridine55 synthase TruB [Rhodobacteraceae bacterium HLUCCA09]|nr:MAG: tRNA pseudouridine55 synthase TruB [Rhodobacteraceae bacterium HLUCCA09]
MARRRKGRDISGWVILDKPAGPTSTAVVNKVRWAFDAKKAGHAGTLDPAATGVLAVALGEATKVVPLVTDALKAYRFTMRFGQATTTDDAEGDVLATSGARPSDDAIRAALAPFTGWIEQVPPKYSAVKVAGERAYDLARDDEQFDLAARPLFVDSLELVERPDPDHAVLEMVCGKGGYVRAIARDLGAALGCLGHVVTLRRPWSGPFEAGGALALEELERLARTPELDAHLRPIEDGLAGVPEARMSPAGATRLRNGNPGEVTHTAAAYGDTAWASERGRAIGLGTYRGGLLHPTRVFNLGPA